MMLALIPTLALALPAQEPCESVVIVQSDPVQGSVGAPVDVAPAVLVRACGMGEDVMDVIVSAEGGAAPVYTGAFGLSSGLDVDVLIELPMLSLDPETAYVMQLVTPWATEHLRFETGTGVAGPVALPGLDAVQWFGQPEGESWTALVLGTVVLGDPGFVRVRSDDSPDLDVLAGPGGAFRADATFDVQTPCVFPEVRDSQGVWHPGAPFCGMIGEVVDRVVPFDDLGDGGWGCSSTPNAAWGLLVAPMLVLRRRGSLRWFS